MKANVLFSLLMLASIHSVASAGDIDYVVETGTTVVNEFDSGNKGPLGMDFKKFVSDGEEQFIRIGAIGDVYSLESTKLELGLEARTREGKTSEFSFYGRAVIGSGNLKGFFGGHFGTGKDSDAQGQSFNVSLVDLGGNTILAGAHSKDSPKYSVAGAEVGAIYDFTKNVSLVLKGEVQTKSYDLAVELDDPSVQSTLSPLSFLDVEEAKRFETDVMEWKTGLAIRFVF